MSIIEKLKNSWIYSIVVTIISSSAITWGVVQNIVVLPIRDDLVRQIERSKQLESILEQVKNEYDIPDYVLSDFGNKSKHQSQEDLFRSFNVIEKKSFSMVNTTINRNQTTQIKYSGFPITISVANVKHDGETTFNVGYALPTSEIPQSLQLKLFPAQTMTIQSSEETGKVLLFYINLLAADPARKRAIIDVYPLQSLKKLIDHYTENNRLSN